MLTWLAMLAFSIAAIFGCLTVKYFLESLRSNPYELISQDYLHYHAGLTSAYRVVQESSKE